MRNLLRQALDRIPLIMWSLVVDLWRWDVFAGRVDMDNYNRHWWKLRYELQGVRPPVPRTEANFDALAKFHIPDNSPYMPYVFDFFIFLIRNYWFNLIYRYFFSSFLQVQFFEGMCEAEYGREVNLRTCDIYNSTSAGKRMRQVTGYFQISND